MVNRIKKMFISLVTMTMMISMSPVNSFAESGNTVPQSMVQTILKNKSTVTENLKYHLNNGTLSTSGVFTDSGASLGSLLPFTDGIYLGSNSTAKQNDPDETAQGDGVVDSDLSKVISENESTFYTNENKGPNGEISSASWLSFETKAKGKALSFNYVFASNEFNQPSSFNDTFALFVTNKGKLNRDCRNLNITAEEDIEAYYQAHYDEYTVNIAKFTGASGATETINIQSLLNQAKSGSNTTYLQTKNADDDGLITYTPNADYTKNKSYGQTVEMTALYEKSEYGYKDDDTLEIKFAIANCADNVETSYVFIEANSLGFNTPQVKVNYGAKTLSNFAKGTYEIRQENDEKYYFTFTNNNMADNSIPLTSTEDFKDNNGKDYDFRGDTIVISEYNTVTQEASTEETQTLSIDTEGTSPAQLETDNIEIISDGSDKTVSFTGVAGDEYMVLPSYIQFTDDADADLLWSKNAKTCTAASPEIEFTGYKNRKSTTELSFNTTNKYVIYSRKAAVKDDNGVITTPASYYTRSNFLIEFTTPENVSVTNASEIGTNGKLNATTKVAYRLYSDANWRKVENSTTSLPVGEYILRNQYTNDAGTTVIGANLTKDIVAEAPVLTATPASSTDGYGVVSGVKSTMQYKFNSNSDSNWHDVTSVATETNGVVFDSSKSEFRVKASRTDTSVMFRYKSVTNENGKLNNSPSTYYNLGLQGGKIRYNLQKVDNIYDLSLNTKLIWSATELDSSFLSKAHTTDVNIITLSNETSTNGYFYTYTEEDFTNDGTSTDKWQIAYDISAYEEKYTEPTTVTLDATQAVHMSIWLQKGDDKLYVDVNDTDNLPDKTLENNKATGDDDHTITVSIGGITKNIFVAGKLKPISAADKETITKIDPTEEGENNASIVFSGTLLTKVQSGLLEYCAKPENGDAADSDYKDVPDNSDELKVTGGKTYLIRYKKTLNADNTVCDAASLPIEVYVKAYKTTDGLEVVKADATDASNPTKGFIINLNNTTMELSKGDDSYDPDHQIDISAITGTKYDGSDHSGLDRYTYYYVRYAETEEHTASKSVKIEIPSMVVNFADTYRSKIKVIYSDDEDTAPMVSGLLPFSRVYASQNGELASLQPGMEYYESATAVDTSDIDDDDWETVISKDKIQLNETTSYLYVRQREYDHEGKLPNEDGYLMDTYASDVLTLPINNGLSGVTAQDATYDSTKTKEQNTTGKLKGLKAGMCYRNHESQAWTTVNTDGDVDVSIGTYDIAYSADDLNSVNKYKTLTVKYAAPEAITASPLNGQTYGYIFNISSGAYYETLAEYKSNTSNWRLIDQNSIKNGAFNSLKPGTYVLCYASQTPTDKTTEGKVQTVTIAKAGLYTNMKKETSYTKGVYLVSNSDLDTKYVAAGTTATAKLPSTGVSYVYYDGSSFASDVTRKSIYSFEEINYSSLAVNYKDSIERPNNVGTNHNTTVSTSDIVVTLKDADNNQYTLLDNGSYSLGSDNQINIGTTYVDYITSKDDKIDLTINGTTTKVTVESCAIKNAPEEKPTVTVVPPTAENNGKIEGVSSEMEYSSSKSFDKDVHDITGNSIQVKSGTWYVRYKTKDNYEEATGDNVTKVFVPYYTGPLSYKLNVVSTGTAHIGTGYQAYIESVDVYSRSSDHSPNIDDVETISITDAMNRGLEFNQLYISGASISSDVGYTFKLTKDGETIASKSGTIYCQGHTYVTDYGYAATGSSTGLTNGSHCSVCGYVNVPQQVIAVVPNAVGYTYNVGTTECRIITNNDASRTVAYKNKQNTTKYQTIPGTVVLNGQTFTVTALKKDCVNGTYVKTLTLVSSITTWEAGAFDGDNKLTKINVKSTTLNVETGAFAKMKASSRKKLKVYVTKKMSKANFNALKAKLVQEGLKASNIKRM